MVTLATNIPGAAATEILLSVEGLGVGATARPANTDFVQQLGKISISKSVTFSNCNTDDVVVTGARSTARPRASSGSLPRGIARTLHHGESFALAVVMAPTGLPGPRVATLVVEQLGRPRDHRRARRHRDR